MRRLLERRAVFIDRADVIGERRAQLTAWHNDGDGPVRCRGAGLGTQLFVVEDDAQAIGAGVEALDLA